MPCWSHFNVSVQAMSMLTVKSKFKLLFVLEIYPICIEFWLQLLACHFANSRVWAASVNAVDNADYSCPKKWRKWLPGRLQRLWWNAAIKVNNKTSLTSDSSVARWLYVLFWMRLFRLVYVDSVSIQSSYLIGPRNLQMQQCNWTFLVRFL